MHTFRSLSLGWRNTVCFYLTFFWQTLGKQASPIRLQGTRVEFEFVSNECLLDGKVVEHLQHTTHTYTDIYTFTRTPKNHFSMIDQILPSIVDHWQPILLRIARTTQNTHRDCRASININTPEVIQTYKAYLFHVNRLNMLEILAFELVLFLTPIPTVHSFVRSFDFCIDGEKVKRAEAIALSVLFDSANEAEWTNQDRSGKRMENPMEIWECLYTSYSIILSFAPSTR